MPRSPGARHSPEVADTRQSAKADFVCLLQRIHSPVPASPLELPEEETGSPGARHIPGAADTFQMSPGAPHSPGVADTRQSAKADFVCLLQRIHSPVPASPLELPEEDAEEPGRAA